MNKKIKTQKRTRKVKKKNILNINNLIVTLSLILFLVLTLGFVFYYTEITGMFIGEEEWTSYQQNLNFDITESRNQSLILSEDLDNFNLRSLKLSGEIIGNGSVKVYLATESNTYLIFGEEDALDSVLSTVTGNQVAVEGGSDGSSDSNSGGESSSSEGNSAEISSDNNGDKSSGSSNDVKNNIANNEMSNNPGESNTKKKLDSNYGEDNSEPLNNPADVELEQNTNHESVEENINPSPNLPDTNLEPISTPGGNIFENNSQNEPIHSEINIEDNNTNNLNKQDQNRTAKSINTTFFDNEIILEINETITSTLNDTNLTTINMIININETIINTTENITKEVIYFRDLCSETCLFYNSINSSELKLIVELEQGTELKLTELWYAVESSDVNDTNLTEINYTKIKDDPNYDAIISSAEFDNESNKLTVIFSHNSTKLQPIFIIGKIENYILSKNQSTSSENVTLIISDWDNQYFKIKIGTHSEIIAFGEPEEYDLNFDILDHVGNLVNVYIEFIDEYTNQIKQSKNLEWNRSNDKNKSESSRLKIKEGTYKIKITPVNHTIKLIEIPIFEVNSNSTNLINIDEVNITEEFSNFIQVYAIDPTKLNFTNATVTVTAKGSELYKCKNWNFTLQSCVDRNWTLFKSGLVPGQDYHFTLTPEDPGFGELISQNSSKDVDMAPLDNTTFVLVYASVDKSVYFKVYHTNGTIISNGTIDSSNQPLYPRVAVSAINQTHFVVVWINDHDTINNIANVTLAIYDLNGTKLTNDILVDNNIAAVTGDSHITDLSVTKMGDKILVGWADDIDGDAQFNIFDNNGVNLTSIFDVDTTVATPSPLCDFISVSAINSTQFIYGWWDQGVNDLAYIIYNQTGGEIVARVNVDPTAGTDSRVSVAALDNNKFVYAFYLSNDGDIGYSIIQSNGTVLIPNTIIEPNAGPTTGTWLDVAAVKSNNYANDSFVLVWYNQTAGNIVAATYYGNGTNIATFIVDTEENANYNLMSVMGKESGIGQQICPGTFIISYSNSSNVTNLRKYYLNGTAWDGSCAVNTENDNPPTVNLVYPNNGNSSVSSVNFTCNATDDHNLTNITFYWNYSGTFIDNETVIVTGTFNQTIFARNNLSKGIIIWNCYACDNTSQCSFSGLNYTVNITGDVNPPNITFNYQNPTDLNLTNFLGPEGVNISYNLTDETGLNNNTIQLFYKSNSTQSNIHFYLNGTAYSGYFSKNPIQNGTPTYTWTLHDNEVLPGTYNYGEITMERTPHSKSTLVNQNDYISIEFYNVSDSKQYSFFEIMVNRTLGAGSLRFYYCNSSYNFGNSPIGNINCVNFYSLNNNTYNHIHSNYSAHMLAPMTINSTSGMIGNVKVSSTSYLIIRGIGITTWSYYYINDSSRNGAYKNSNNGGNLWTNLTYTIDSHLHQFGTNTSLWYYVCANDTLNLSNCSTIRQDLFELAGLPPTAPGVYSPMEGIYSKNITINYTSSESPNGYPITFYNISLFYTNETFVHTISSNNSLNISYVWDSTSFNGEYLIKVEACDSLNQCSSGYSENITLDNIGPIVSLNYPSNNYINDSGSTINLTFNCSVTDNIRLNNLSLFITNPGNQSFALNQTTNLSGTSNSSLWNLTLGVGNYTWSCNAYDYVGNLGWGENRTIILNSTYENITNMTGYPNLTITLNPDNSSSNLNWTYVNGAESYTIFYSSNLCEIETMNASNISGTGIINITNLTSLNWTDINASYFSTTRYYRVAAVRNSTYNLGNDTVGTYTYRLFGINSGTNDNYRKNWISLPVDITIDAETFIFNIPNDYGIRIKQLNRIENSNYNFIVHNKAGPNNFTMNTYMGYEIEVSNDVNYTIVGKAITNLFIYNFLGIPTGTNDNYRKNWIGIRSCTINNSDAETFIFGVPNDYGIRIKKLERLANNSYAYLVHNKLGPNNYTLNLGYGYETEVSNDVNYTFE